MQLKAALGTMAALLDTVITKDQPILQGELPLFAGRIEGLRAPVVEGPSFSFRKKASRVFSLREYDESGRITGAQKTLLEAAVAARKNILVVGGTGTGKTTFINALLRHLQGQSPDDRIVLIEDTRELQCALQNKVELRAIEGTVSMNGLLRSTLRLRPDRIIVGEVRGPEALTLLKAWNTGHPGGFSSLHANDAQAALRRIEMLIQEACGQRMPELIAEVVDLIVHLERGANVEGLLRVHGYEHGRYQTRTWECDQ
ncbi:MAG: P-type conjugative transfer ATPase TrbB [Myxococcales bacterium]|nr:P-type conjugative transfer ATPase TrbB [Myxococcales bacterium]